MRNAPYGYALYVIYFMSESNRRGWIKFEKKYVFCVSDSTSYKEDADNNGKKMVDIHHKHLQEVRGGN